MSIYNIEYQTTLNYYKKHIGILLSMSDKEYISSYFLIGEKDNKNKTVNKKEQQFSMVMTEMLCTENCELINYINDKITAKKTTDKRFPLKQIIIK